ncbi:MAG: flagellar filament outer layer protein FlaA [Spirochaetaceae bacterium]
MKRFGILLGVLLLMVSFSVAAEESVLIDFSTLTADLEDGNNEATLVDFADKAGPGYTDEEKELMKTSLAIENWNVELANSSQTVNNMSLSYTKEAPVRDDAEKFAGETVMGIRVHFPDQPFNSHAMVKPPFDIPAYMQEDEDDRSGNKFEGYGVVKNVGTLKKVEVNAYGSNFPNGLAIVLEDQDGKEQNLFLNYMDFDGWRTLGWLNPNYIEEVRNRELRQYPLYPRTTPLRKLKGFLIYKDAAQEGGDIITYIKDVKLTYDLATMPDTGDIDNEQLWGILEEREQSRRDAEWQKLGQMQVLRALEERKLHQDEQEQEEEQEEEQE